MTESMSLIVELLNSDDVGEQMSGLKQLKNALIGHVDRKSELLAECIITQVLDILSVGLSLDCRTEAAIIIGSFAHGSDETVGRLLEYPVIDCLLNCLNQPNARTAPKLSCACLRAIVTMLEVRGPSAVANHERAVVELLYKFLSGTEGSPESSNIGSKSSTSTTSSGGGGCSSTVTPIQVLNQCYRMIPLLGGNALSSQGTSWGSTAAGGIGSGLDMSILTPHVAAHIALLTRQYRKMALSTLPLDTALAALSKCITGPQAKQLLRSGPGGPNSISGDEFVDTLLEYTRADSGSVRLTAVELLARLQKHADSTDQARMMTLPLLPTIFPLVSNLDTDPRVSLCIAYICRDSEHCSELAVEVGLVTKLMDTLKSLDLDNWKHSELIENNLLALSGIGIHRDPFRQEIVDEGAVPYIISIFKKKPADKYRSVKAAACYLLRSLSRSVAMLRTNTANYEIVDAVVDLLKENPDDTGNSNQVGGNLEVRTSVMATICNLVLEFSPVNKYLLNKGILDEIVSSTRSSYSPLRLNAIWSLKHLIYDASESLRDAVITKLTCDHLFALWDDAVLSVQEQALEFVRNFTCRNENGIDLMLNYDGHLFSRMQSKLDLAESHPNIALPCVYIMTHIAASSDRHKDLITSQEELFKRLVPLLSNECTELRVACTWVLINLTWNEDQTNEARTAACKARVETLLRLGFRDKLASCTNDPCLDMRERVKTALFQLDLAV